MKIRSFFYLTIVQWVNERDRLKIIVNFEKERNNFFLNDWKKQAKWVVHKHWKNEIKNTESEWIISKDNFTLIKLISSFVAYKERKLL